MIGRKHVALFTLLILILLILLSVRLETNLLSFRAFQLESTLLYVITSSFALGALILFLLLTLLPQKSRSARNTPSLSSPQLQPSVSKLLEADAFLEMGENDQAESILDQQTFGRSEEWYVHKLRGDLYLNKGNSSRAEECYRAALNVTMGTRRSFLQCSLAALYEYQGRMEEAVEMYASALRINPALPEPLFRLRQLAVEEQDWKKALSWQERVESDLPGLPEGGDRGWRLGIRLQLAWEEYTKGSFKTAQALVKYVLRMTDLFPSAYLLAGEIQERTGHSAAAVKTWERGVAKTHHPVLMRRISDFYLMQNQPAKAISYFQDAGHSGANDHFPEFCLGDLYLRLEMLEEAKRVFESIRRKEPGWVLNEMALGEVYHRSGKSGAAADIFLELVKSFDTGSIQIWQCYNCGTTYPEYNGYCIGCLDWNTINLNRNQAGRVEMKNAQSGAWPS